MNCIENATAKSPPATRHKSPSRLMRDKALDRWIGDVAGPSPVDRKYPPGMVAIVCARTGASRKRVYLWLAHPDRHPLSWSELSAIAAELGGFLRCMFSEIS